MLTDVKFENSDYSKDIINQSISDILNENYLMNMATVKSENEPWICSVFFAFDEEAKLYCLTYPSSEHINNINKNSKVAISITNSTQDPDGSKRGLQLSGSCRLVEDELEMQTAIDLYTERFPWFRKYITKPKDFERSSLDSRFYILEIKEIKIFDEVMFGEETWVNLVLK